MDPRDDERFTDAVWLSGCWLRCDPLQLRRCRLSTSSAVLETPHEARVRGAVFVEAAKGSRARAAVTAIPATRQPTQWRRSSWHVPLRYGGPHDHEYGIAVQLHAWHGDTPTLAPSIALIPGNPHWRLAPAQWPGRANRADICLHFFLFFLVFIVQIARETVKRSLSKSIDTWRPTQNLVGWGVAPGPKVSVRPAPGTQAQVRALIQAWDFHRRAMSPGIARVSTLPVGDGFRPSSAGPEGPGPLRVIVNSLHRYVDDAGNLRR